MKTKLKFESFADLSTSQDRKGKRRMLAGQINTNAIKDIPTSEDVRDCLIKETKTGCLSRRPVHDEIMDSLMKRADQFAYLNNGLTIVSSKCTISKDGKTITLEDPSIVNGAQTQGCVKYVVETLEEVPDSNVLAVIAAMGVEDEARKTMAITRNNQINVKKLSRMGKMGCFEGLQLALQGHGETIVLAKKEGETPVNCPATNKLLQAITVLLPEELMTRNDAISTGCAPNKSETFFENVFKNLTSEEDHKREPAEALYQFYLDMAYSALQLFRKWNSHELFHNFQKIRKFSPVTIKNGEVVRIKDGMLFPILAAHHVLVYHDGDAGRLKDTTEDQDSKIYVGIDRAYKEAGGDISYMRKDLDTYDTVERELRSSMDTIEFLKSQEKS